MKTELPITVPISRIIDEAKGIKSIILPVNLNSKPGQFVMIWIPGFDAKPMGVSYQDQKSFGVTVSSVGSWSEKISRMKAGNLLGVFGPYGSEFNLEGENIVIVGGGYGIASLMLLVQEAVKKKINITLLIGAKSKSYLLYQDRLKKMKINTLIATDDGSFGEKGFNTQILERLLKEKSVDKVFACGPEMMEKRVAELCIEKKVDCEISIERYMKCGFGVCGACCTDAEGKRVCVEGTVFTATEALCMKEFGKYHRDGSATKHRF